jgi:hypothetical protein
VHPVRNVKIANDQYQLEKISVKERVASREREAEV